MLNLKQLSWLMTVALMSTTANAQFGGFGEQVDGFEFANHLGPDGPGFIESREILIAISNSGKTVTAFSSQTGKIDKLNFEKKVEPFVPIVGDSVACFSVGKTAYAFSSVTGKWDSVETDDNLFTPVLSSNMIGVSNGKRLHAFGSQQGKWLTIETEGQLIPTLTFNTVKATDGEKIYICSDNSTEWQVIDLESDE